MKIPEHLKQPVAEEADHSGMKRAIRVLEIHSKHCDPVAKPEIMRVMVALMGALNKHKAVAESIALGWE